MATLSVSGDVTVVVNANRGGGACTTLSMLLDSLVLSGVPPTSVLVVCRGGAAPDVPDGVRVAAPTPECGDLTGLRHVAERPFEAPTRWVVYLQDVMVVGDKFVARVVEACAKADSEPSASTSTPLCVTLDSGAGLFDVHWLSSLDLSSAGSLQDVLDACPDGCLRRLDPEVRDMGTFRYPGDAEPPRRIAWFPALDVYEFLP